MLFHGLVLRPEVLPGTVLLRTRAIGVNYANVYRRWGNYHLMDQSPYILGCEAAGEVVAVGGGRNGRASRPMYRRGRRAPRQRRVHADALGATHSAA